MGRADFFYAIFVRALVLGAPLALIPNDIRRTVPAWTLAVILTAGGPLVRRLHDIGQSGLHAPWLCFCLVLGCALNYQLPRHYRLPDPAAVDTTFFFFLSWVPYLLLLVLMLWPGVKTPNRNGAPSA